jgi:hypothetical protein
MGINEGIIRPILIFLRPLHFSKIAVCLVETSVLTMTNINATTFWDAAPCSLL